MAETETYWDLTKVQATLKSSVTGTDNVVDWLKSPSFTGSTGIWYQSRTNEEPVAISQGMELAFKADMGANVLLGSVAAAAIAISALAF